MKISVVIPVYNKEKYMDDLFQCLLSQTFEGKRQVFLRIFKSSDFPYNCN